MTNEKRDIFDGRTINEYYKDNVEELDFDIIGFYTIVAFGREGFKLEGTPLVKFTFDCLTYMLNAGAAPVKGDGTKSGRWIRQTNYGTTNAQIVNSIIEEWQASGKDPTYALWFGLPKHYQDP